MIKALLPLFLAQVRLSLPFQRIAVSDTKPRADVLTQTGMSDTALTLLQAYLDIGLSPDSARMFAIADFECCFAAAEIQAR